MEDSKSRSSRAMNYFEEGKKFMEQILKENEQLRLIIAKLKKEKRDAEEASMRGQLDILQRKFALLEEENGVLQDENRGLRDRFSHVESENREFAERYVSVERQNSDLISLYVASYQLHATLNYDEVLSAVKEIVINLVGAEDFGVYLREEETEALHLIAREGLDGIETPEVVPLGEGIIGQVGQTGDVYVETGLTGGHRNQTQTPIICIPLKMGEDLTGVVAIYSLLVQKQGLETVDYELFELLGHQAATALYGARLYMVSERKRNTIEGFLEIIKADAKTKIESDS